MFANASDSAYFYRSRSGYIPTRCRMAIFEKVSRVDVRFRGFPHLYINRGHFSEDREAGQSSTEEGHSWIKRDPDAPSACSGH